MKTIFYSFTLFTLLNAFGPQSPAAEIKDPAGYYKIFCDPSITNGPAKDMKIGKGQIVSLTYDGSKGGPSLFYQLSFVDPTGDVRPITGGPFDAKEKGVFARDIKVFTSEADGRPGFVEVSTISGVGMAGKKVKLAIFPVVFEISR
ncbi:MAG: hypothetical protein ABI992_13770 [Chthoniobacterales bacterium]